MSLDAWITLGVTALGWIALLVRDHERLRAMAEQAKDFRQELVKTQDKLDEVEKKLEILPHLEATIEDLSETLRQYHVRLKDGERALAALDKTCAVILERLKRGVPNGRPQDPSDCP